MYIYTGRHKAWNSDLDFIYENQVYVVSKKDLVRNQDVSRSIWRLSKWDNHEISLEILQKQRGLVNCYFYAIIGDLQSVAKFDNIS